MQSELIEANLAQVLKSYQTSFSAKVYGSENEDHDLLMDIFGISPQLKRENRQYWGRELGMRWQRTITELCKVTCEDYGPAIQIGKDEPCDLVVGKHAIDTKYRIGSGDSGTLKKFKAYGPILQEMGYEPVLLILREDNLPAAIQACIKGGWNVFTNEGTFEFIRQITGFDLEAFLTQKGPAFEVVR